MSREIIKLTDNEALWIIAILNNDLTKNKDQFKSDLILTKNNVKDLIKKLEKFYIQKDEDDEIIVKLW